MIARLKQIVSVGVLLNAFGGLSHADEKVDEWRTVSATGSIRVDCVRGDLNILGWDRAEIHVAGSLDDLAERLHFEVEGDQTLIRVVLDGEGGNWGDGSDLVIHVPAQSRLQVEAVSADIEIADVKGPVAVRTVSGDIDAERLGEQTRISTTTGDVTLTGSGGRVKVVTASGDATLDLSATDVSVDTVSGEVELELEAFDSVMANTVSGELEIEGQLNPEGRVAGTTVNGDIDLRLEEPVNAGLDIRTGSGGEIDNALSDEPVQKIPGALILRTSLGDGSGGIRLSSVNGEIRLEGR